MLDKEDIIRLVMEAGFKYLAEAEYWHPEFQRFAALVEAAVREECANTAEEYLSFVAGGLGKEVSDAIRNKQ